MKLLTIENGRVIITPEALGINLFKNIWEMDTDPQKGNATRLLTYVTFMCYPGKENPFYGEPEETRGSKVKMELYGNANKEDTEFMMLGVVRYKELLTMASPAYPLLEASLIAANKLKNYLLNFNLEERTDSGAAVIKPKEITATLKEIASTVTSLQELRNKVISELTESSKTRKDREPGDYER